jgi:hypothetical protein
MHSALPYIRPRIPHLCFHGHICKAPDMLRLGRNGLIFVSELEIPWLENRLEHVHGAAVFVPFKRGNEEVQDVREKSGYRELHLGRRVED